MATSGPRLAARLTLLTLLLGWWAAPAGATPALHVIPFPGTPDASPYSHIIFSSLNPSELRSVTVTGSSSGAHGGRKVALPDGAGAAFLPSHSFTPGETVHVMAVLSSPAAGTASGDPGATALDFSFTVAVPMNSGAATDKPSSAGAPSRKGASRSTSLPPTQSFRSAPGLHPPQISADAHPPTHLGDIFLTPKESPQDGPMIIDARGRLVWFRPVSGGYASNLEVQHYRGQPVLTWWQQAPLAGGGVQNEDVIADRAYRTVAVLHGDEGYVPDLHELQLTRRHSALIMAFPHVRADLRSVGGPANGVVLDCVIQELDVRTDEVLWEWHMLGHVPLSDTYARQYGATAPLDFCHMNSIQSLPNGNLLVSARNTWAVYEISRQTGQIVWTLAGRHPSFTMGSGTNFEWQHDAHLVGHTLTVFDDGALPQEERQSSAKVLRLDATARTASLVHRYTHSPPLLAGLAGSVQILANQDVFVGWGRQPDFSEYTSGGHQIFNASLPFGVYSYRAYRFPWAGQPNTRPSLAVSNQAGGQVKVYVSWNGATDVWAWRLEGGPRRSALRSLAQSRRTGFETVLTLSQPERYLAVQAVNGQDKVIGTSRVHRS